ncbi:MAG: helix-turn-helix domain-containing protein [Bacteroidales bacterium]|nr:helix-turn-helix domain-containing protein [Bacteroidales bacterium]
MENLYDASFKQICNWVHRFEEYGVNGLKDKPRSGHNPKLTEKKLKELSAAA